MSALAKVIEIKSMTEQKINPPRATSKLSVPVTPVNEHLLAVKLFFTNNLMPPAVGLAVMLLIWTLLSISTPSLPNPIATWHSAVELFSDPFYSNGPNDQGIGWNVLSSLARVGIGFGMAALIGIPLGFMIGSFKFLDKKIGRAHV